MQTQQSGAGFSIFGSVLSLFQFPQKHREHLLEFRRDAEPTKELDPSSPAVQALSQIKSFLQTQRLTSQVSKEPNILDLKSVGQTFIFITCAPRVAERLRTIPGVEGLRECGRISFD